MSMFITFTWRPPAVSSRAYRQGPAAPRAERAIAGGTTRRGSAAEFRRRAPCQPRGVRPPAQPRTFFVCRTGAQALCRPEACGGFAAKAVRQARGRLAPPGSGRFASRALLRVSVRTEFALAGGAYPSGVLQLPLTPRRPKRCWRWPDQPAAASLWPSSWHGAKPAAIIGWRVDGVALTWSDRCHRGMPREAWRGSAVAKVTARQTGLSDLQ
jgi:hypothetical protein